MVGGAVRDRLLGVPPEAISDRDHVVVGATVKDMLAAGFQPVGRDFPVFLHPLTHEEYALARTERKTAPGYAGFVFHADANVTLEDDLARRDLTVNAIAEDESSGALIDPFGGVRDVEARVFRHVGPAFVEDPVRILRVARFAARLPDFSLARETLALMRAMVEGGEVDALVPERVWQEMARGLAACRPSRMIEVLRLANALERIAPEIDELFRRAAHPHGRDVDDGPGSIALEALDRSAALGASLRVRFSALTFQIENDSLRVLCERLVVPAAVRDLALMASREMDRIEDASDAEKRLALFERCDAFRRPARIDDLLLVYRAKRGDDASAIAAIEAWMHDLACVRAVDAGAIARAQGHDPARIAPAVRQARLAVLRRGTS